jgi:hypothetical protein
MVVEVQPKGAPRNFRPSIRLIAGAAQEGKFDQVNLLMNLLMERQNLPIAVVGCGVSP